MNATVSLNLIQTGVLLFAFIGAVRLVGVDRRTTRVVFFAFAMACALLSNLYWLAYDILRPETRMPFAANEIGEWALFLLMGASLGADPVPGTLHIEAVCAALFSAASAALWIAWSGEWVQDILTGAAYGYFICRLLVRIRREGVFSGWEWKVLAAVCPVLIVAQASIFFVPVALKRPLDLFCYALLFAVTALLIARAALALKNGAPAEAAVLRAYAAYAWTLTALYMSAGGFYTAALMLGTLCILLMFLALRREAAAA